MPVIWRYLITQYLRVLALCTLAFIGVLLVTRLREIAQFSSLGGDGGLVLRFALYQVPYILPIALPISSLISSLILFQQLSQTKELTALRSSGISLFNIISPILVAGGCVGLLNFYIISEVATESHLATRQLEHRIRSINPLILLQTPHLFQSRGAFVSILGSTKPGESAQDVVVAINMQNQKRLSVFLAKDLSSDQEQLTGRDVTILSSLDSGVQKDYDHLIIENTRHTLAPLARFSNFVKKGGWRLANDHLNFSLLRIRIETLSHQLQQQLAVPYPDPKMIERAQSRLNRAWSEVIRRFSVGLAILTFTLMGVSYGVSVGRQKSIRGTITVALLAGLYLTCFFCAKNMDRQFYLATAFYLLPHVLITVLSVIRIRRIRTGREV